MKRLFLDVIKREKYRRIVAAVIFLLIILKVFLSVTYLFRNANWDRDHVIGIKEEKTLDMVYVGGSAAFVYWQPLKAWNDCGFTSYNLAVNKIQAESIEYLIKYALKYQDPECFVIDARAFQYYSLEGSSAGLRNASDSLDFFSLERWEMVHEYLNHHNIEEGEDKLSFYLDICKYHTKYAVLGVKANWDRIINTGNATWKGFEWIYKYKGLETPEAFRTDERAEFLEEDLDTLYNLLELCQEKELNVLFVVCPYQITEEHQKKYNTIEDVVTSYGFDFLNANEYYDEIDINFSTDFYNGAHVNCYGAEKYTAFLGKYITEHFNLPDHRGESAYEEWNKDYEKFLQKEQEVKAAIDALIQEAQEKE